MSTAPAAPLRVALTSLGCKVNFAEMADLAGVLAAAGRDVVHETEHADVRVLNSCTVTMQADATTRQRLRRLRRFDPDAHLVLTGCSVDANPQRYLRLDPDGGPIASDGIDAVFANSDKEHIADHVLELAAGLHTRRRSAAPFMRTRAFIKVQDGCNHRCTYCIVWQARGASISRPPEQVIAQVEHAVQEGHAEVVLCGVDLGSYGRDLGTNLATLVGRVLEQHGEHTRIRLSSVNANDVTPALVEFNAHPRLCAHWHMPLQSGSDTVLRAMHRGYRRAQYLRVVQTLRERDPLTEFTTDVMVAFPGETDAEHADTLSLIDEVGFLSCHVFRWSPRPGTPATSLTDRLGDATARRRSAEARRAATVNGAASRRRAVGREHEVIWERAEDGDMLGVAGTYHEIVARDDGSLRPGTVDRVMATAVEGDRLRVTLLRR